MDYRSEARKLRAEQDRLDSIRQYREIVVKIVLYSIAVVGGQIALWYLAVTTLMFTQDGYGFISIMIVVAMIIGSVIGTVWWFIGTDEHVDDIDTWFENLSEESELAKTEKDRKAKIDFYNRLDNDPDFRKAWEDQMRSKS